MPSVMHNKPSLNYFMRERDKNALKTLKMKLSTLYQAYGYCFQL